MPVKIWCLRQGFEQESGDEHEQGNDDRHEHSVLAIAWVKLAGDDLDTILEIYPGYVETKCVAGEQSDVFEEVAR